MVIQVIFRDPRSGTEQKYEFDQSPVRIGRNPLNNVVLEGNFVSGWHGIIRFDDTGTYYFDLGSTNGTCQDGKRLPKNTPIPIPQATRLTVWMFELTIVPAPSAASAAPKAPGRGFPSETLIGTGRTTEVFATSSLSKSVSGASAVSLPHPAPPAPPPTAPGAASGAAPLVGRSRIVSTGGRALTPPPPGATPRQPSQILPPKPAVEPTSDRLLRCLRVIGAFADAFMGLKKGYEQFGSEVGVRPLSGTTPLHRARTSQEIVDFLLDPGTDTEACARDLNAVFADMGIHDLALMEGISQSVRSLLAKLDPNGLDLKTTAGLWSGGKAKAKWTSYVETFNNLLSEEAALHAEIFGEEFAAGYASVARGDIDIDVDVDADVDVDVDVDAGAGAGPSRAGGRDAYKLGDPNAERAPNDYDGSAGERDSSDDSDDSDDSRQ